MKAVKSASTLFAAATVGMLFGLTAHTGEPAPADCASASAFGDQLVSAYADAYERSLRDDLDVDEIYRIQSDLSTVGKAYAIRRDACSKETSGDR